MPVTLAPAGGSDRVTSGASHNAPTNWTVCGWFRRASGVAAGELISLSKAGPVEQIGVFWSSSTADRLHIDRLTSSVPGRYQVLQANLGVTLSASKWVFLAVTQAGTANPTVYTACPADGVALASRTITVAQAPTGTADTTAGNIYYGNWVGLDYSLAGDLAWWGFHNVVLTVAEIEEAMWRGLTLRGLMEASSLESTTRLFDLSGGAATLTGTGLADVEANPPVHPLWVPTARGSAQEAQALVSGALSVSSDSSVTIDATTISIGALAVSSDTLVTIGAEIPPVEGALAVESGTLVTVAGEAIIVPKTPYGRDLSDDFGAGDGERGDSGGFGAALDDGRTTVGGFLP
jgi:hypothetical protein